MRAPLPILGLLALAATGAPPDPPPPRAAEARTLVERLVPLVEEIRGLKFKETVSVEMADDAAARRHFEDRLRTYWPEDRMLVEQDLFLDLGLLPQGTDLKETLFVALEEQAGGYYDPRRRTFVVLSDMPWSMAPIIVAHELTHALDDQHFDIDGMLRGTQGIDERAGAVAAVVEGSGTLVMTLYIVREIDAGRFTPEIAGEIRESEAGKAERLKSAPQILQRLLVGPYVLGMAFLLKGDLAGMPRAVAPAADLERAFRRPPVSWEQILHPEKYWIEEKQDPPRPVVLPDLAATLGEGWSLAGEGGLGEMVLAILTGPGGEPFDPTSFEDPGRWTNTGAAGWGGDRWQLYRRGGETVTLLATRWDSERDAREFEAALSPARGRLLVRRGDAAVLVAGDAGARARALARNAMKSVAAARD
ncbi:MAG: hypothetical protein ACRD6R_01250 [Candidatus Polarisedimenticolia bacterium]